MALRNRASHVARSAGRSRRWNIRALLVPPRMKTAGSRFIPAVYCAILLLERTGSERVAVLWLARVHAPPEPAHALFGGAVGERLGHHAALGLLLQAVVADGHGGSQCFFEVAR